MTECVICQGNKFVRLPVYRRASARYIDAAIPLSIAAEESHRTYPCPECNEKTAAEEKVSILYATETIAERGNEPADLQRIVAHSLSKAIADKLLADEMIEISKEKRGDDLLFIAKVGVVSPKTFQRIEERAIEKMTEFLVGVSAEATKNIALWGSSYSGDDGPIAKGMAMRFIREAFDRHIANVKARLKSR